MPGGAAMPNCVVALRDAVAATPVSILPMGQGRLSSIAFSPDGTLLAAAGPDDESCYLWDPATAARLLSLRSAADAKTPSGMREGIGAVAFAPDSQTLATVSRYRWPSNISGPEGDAASARMVRLWEVATGQERLTLRLPRNSVRCAAFAADGRTLLLGSEEGDLLLWHLPTNKLSRRAGVHADVITAIASTAGAFATASRDTTALVWQASAFASALGPAPTDLDEPRLRSLWDDLAAADGTRAYQAVWLLAAAPNPALPWLRQHVRPAPTPAADEVARLLKDLDDDRFALRDRASAELDRLGDAAIAAARLYLSQKPSAEGRRRAERFLERWAGRLPPAEVVQALRAVEVLAQIDTPATRQHLAALAAGAAESRLTCAAQAALARKR